jgi:hypothetical protein
MRNKSPDLSQIGNFALLTSVGIVLIVMPNLEPQSAQPLTDSIFQTLSTGTVTTAEAPFKPNVAEALMTWLNCKFPCEKRKENGRRKKEKIKIFIASFLKTIRSID